MSAYVDLLNETDFSGQNVVTDFLTVNVDATIGGTLTMSALTASTWLALDSKSQLTTRSLVGTINQITITGVGSTYTLATPQDIALSSSPTFAGLTITGLTASMPVKTNGSKALVSSLISLTSDVTNVLPIANGGTNSLAALNNNRLMWSSGSAITEATALTNGQIFIGSTGAAPVAASILGTTNRVTVTAGAGTITLSGPQDIDVTSSPTFASETLTATSNQLILGSTRTVTITAPTPATNSRTHTIPDVSGNANFIMSLGVQSLGGIKTFTSAAVFQASGSQIFFRDGSSGNTIIVNIAGAPAASLSYTLPDVGAAAYFAMTEGAQTLNGVKTFGSLPIISAATATTLLALDASKALQSVSITNANGTNFSFSGSTLAATMSQDLRTTADVTFSIIRGAVVATGITTPSISLSDGVGITTIAHTPSGIATYTLPYVGASANFAMTEGAQTLNGVKTFGSLPIISGSTITRLLATDGSKALQSVTISNAHGCNVSFAGSTLTCTMTQDLTTTGSATLDTLLLNNNLAPLTFQTGLVIVRAALPGDFRTYTMTDVGANANFIMSEGAQTLNGVKTFGSTPVFSSLTASTALYLDASKNLATRTLTNGQLLVGSTGAVPVAASITGTTSQITVTNGAGTITLATPQNIDTAATPTFASTSLTAGTNQLVLGATRTVTLTAPIPATSSRVYTMPDPGADASFVMTESAQTINGVKTFGSGILLPTSTGTPTSFAYYEEFSHTTSWNGAFGASSVSGNVIFTRVGRMVTAKFPAITGTCTTTNQLWMITNAPARFRPPADLYITCGIAQTAAGTLNPNAIAYIAAGGNFQIHNSTGQTFSNSGSPTVGLQQPTCVTYYV